MFSTESELRSIFESFEPPSDDEYEESYEDDDEEAEEIEGPDEQPGEGEGREPPTIGGRLDALVQKAAGMGLTDLDDRKEDQELAEEHVGTGVMTSQLRHFVIQVCRQSAPAHDAGIYASTNAFRHLSETWY